MEFKEVLAKVEELCPALELDGCEAVDQIPHPGPSSNLGLACYVSVLKAFREHGDDGAEIADVIKIAAEYMVDAGDYLMLYGEELRTQGETMKK